jgi:hypothetical protein
MADLMKQLTQTGGGDFTILNDAVVRVTDNSGEFDSEDAAKNELNKRLTSAGGRRRRHSKHHKGNSWLAHVKATMKLNRGKSFKQVLKLAKKSYKKSQSSSSSQSGGKGSKGKGSKGSKGKGTRKGQYGGSGGKVAGVGESASPYV